MAWVSLFLIVRAHCTGDWMQRQGKGPCFLLLSLDPSLILSVSSSSRVLAQSVLTQQPSSVSGSLGQTLTISCTGSPANIGASYCVFWYPQLPGMTPKAILHENTWPLGVPDRFSGSKSGNTGSLTITGLQEYDEADDHGSAWDKNLIAYAVPSPLGKCDKNLLFPQQRGSSHSLLPLAKSAASFVCCKL